MNTKDFNLKQVIQDRANLEANYEWAKQDERPNLPSVAQQKPLPLTAGVWNMVRGFINELRP